MPYIDLDQRVEIDPHIEKLAGEINYIVKHTKEPVTVAGLLNYAVTRLLLKTLPAKRYWAMALGIGTLICVIFEFYRRYVARYEDKAIQKNGDIPEYAEER